MKRIPALALGLMAIVAVEGAEPTKTPVEGYPAFAMGGDVSWGMYITQKGTPKYYTGTTATSAYLTTIPDMVSDHGFDAVRLRVWVDPENPMVKNGFKAKVNGATVESGATYGECGPQALVEAATLYANRGMRIMVCFQMSDTWADPARQYVPAAWADCKSADELKARVVEHVTTVLETLREANVNVAWVQIGNETNSGMLKYLLPETNGGEAQFFTYGCNIASNNTTTTSNFVKVVTAASEAAKSVYPDCKTMIHLANANNWSKILWTFNLIKPRGFNTSSVDMIGLSLYPCNNSAETEYFDYTAKWQHDTDLAIETIGNISTNYGFRSMLNEIGMNNEWSNSSPSSSQSANIKQCNTDVEAFTRYLVENLRDKPSACDGFFYWEPEVDYFDNYTKGACYSITPGSTWPRTKVTANPYWDVVKENSTFPAGGLTDYTVSGIESVEADGNDAEPEYYNIHGLRVAQPGEPGLYIVRRGNAVSKVMR